MSFRLGSLVSTPGALRAMEESGDSPMTFLVKHANGDWGDLGAEDKHANEEALKHDSRIFSAYHLESGEKIWVITEADRSSTCILLPSEY